MLDYLQTLDWRLAAGLFLSENLIVLLTARGLGYGLQRMVDTPGTQQSKPPGISRKEWGIALGTALLNSLITLAGFLLWRNG